MDTNGGISNTATVTIRVLRDLALASAAPEQTSYIYDGNTKKPAVTASYKGTPLALNTDYTVTYINNLNAGTATATMTGMGKYKGTKILTFTIEKTSQAAPASFALQVEAVGDTSYTISIPHTPGAEYRFDDGGWGVSNQKSGCLPGETVIGYKRMAETSNRNHSSVTSASVTLPRFRVKTPSAVPTGSSFTGSQRVTLTCATEGAVIYYTIDGSTPHPGGILYTGAFTLNTTATVKALAIK